MVKLWRESEQASGITRPHIPAVTKSAFLGLSEEERGRLLGDFLIVKDTDVRPEFCPRYEKSLHFICSISLTTLFTDQLPPVPRAQSPPPHWVGMQSVRSTAETGLCERGCILLAIASLTTN